MQDQSVRDLHSWISSGNLPQLWDIKDLVAKHKLSVDSVRDIGARQLGALRHQIDGVSQESGLRPREAAFAEPLARLRAELQH